MHKLKSLDDDVRAQAAAGILKAGQPIAEKLCGLIDHPVAKWEVLALLPLLDPVEAIPRLLDIVTYNREIATKGREHQKKYIRIKAIQELGDMAGRGDSKVCHLLEEQGAPEALAYFIDPKHPHKHQEVREAVVIALKQFDSKEAREKVLAWIKCR
ncbi:hypothetical protein QUF90_27505 [Desulfococcaceae bacterium HSG9]|nr:hypothetical protein [Desulfococcaceae bacterium HSG9]